MKNISRRVFIKGMAVAAVATAASTVLTGCKLPGTVEEVPAPAASKVLKFVDPANDENTLTITLGDLLKSSDAFSAKEIAAIPVKVENALGHTVKVYTSDTIGTETNNQYYILVTAYANNFVGVNPTAGTVQNPITTNGTANGDLQNGYLGYELAKDYTSLTLKVEVKQILDKTNSVFKTVAKQEITYTL